VRMGRGWGGGGGGGVWEGGGGGGGGGGALAARKHLCEEERGGDPLYAYAAPEGGGRSPVALGIPPTCHRPTNLPRVELELAVVDAEGRQAVVHLGELEGHQVGLLPQLPRLLHLASRTERIRHN